MLANISLTTFLAATATAVTLGLLLRRTFPRPPASDGSERTDAKPATTTIAAWAVLAVALILAAVRTRRRPSPSLTMDGGLLDDFRAPTANGYYAPRVYKMKL